MEPGAGERVALAFREEETAQGEGGGDKFMGHQERARSQLLLEQGSLEPSPGRWAGPGGRSLGCQVKGCAWT